MNITKNSPELLLLLIAAGSAMSFAIWQNLLNTRRDCIRPLA